MSDIVKQLRHEWGAYRIANEAADEIERLRAHNAELVAELRRYGLHTADCAHNDNSKYPCSCGWDAALAKAEGRE